MNPELFNSLARSRRSANKNIPEVKDVAAVSCAVQNIYMSGSAYGLGSYWTTSGVTYRQ